jgi:hypothetical protein
MPPLVRRSPFDPARVASCTFPDPVLLGSVKVKVHGEFKEHLVPIRSRVLSSIKSFP